MVEPRALEATAELPAIWTDIDAAAIAVSAGPFPLELDRHRVAARRQVRVGGEVPPRGPPSARVAGGGLAGAPLAIAAPAGRRLRPVVNAYSSDRASIRRINAKLSALSPRGVQYMTSG